MLRMVFLLLMVVGVSLTAVGQDRPYSAAERAVLKERKKSFHCDAYYQVAQNKRQIQVEVPLVKLSVATETEVVRPGDEILRLGMKMKMLCEDFKSNPRMTSEQLSVRMRDLEDRLRDVERPLREHAPASDKVEAIKNTQED